VPRHLTLAVLLLSLATAGGACRREASPRPEPAQRVVEPAPAASTAAGASTDPAAPRPPLSASLAQGARDFGFGVYLPAPVPAAQARAALDAMKQRFPGVPVLAAPSRADRPNALVFAPPLAEFSPPSLESLRYFGRGLDAEQAKAASASRGVLVLAWSLDADPTLARLRAAESLVHELATQLGGTIWDESTRELFSLDAWKKSRLGTWSGDLPNAKEHVVIHYYDAGGGRHRAITLGMQKLGLPDLVVSDVSQVEATGMTLVIDAVAQALVEGASLAPGGELAFDLRAIRQPAAHDALIGAAGRGATLRGRVHLEPARAEEGDPENRIVELTFPAYPGATAEERQSAAIVAIAGAGDDPMSAAREDDAELAAVTARVQKRLPDVAAAFRKGLPLGEHIAVKAPFTTDEGSVEWMWVLVTDWPGEVVRGRLQNDPSFVKSLRLGAKVEVKQASVADYRWMKADGTLKEGGESSEILRHRQGPP
jgi:uncharacterized protein YegJ (DUF2314 family)